MYIGKCVADVKFGAKTELQQFLWNEKIKMHNLCINCVKDAYTRSDKSMETQKNAMNKKCNIC